MRACVLIPARYASTRYPGKPLVPLLGKPMVLWVAELSARAVGADHVYIATESERIADVVREAGFQAVMTQDDALTGTDRIAEAATNLDYDIFLNVQGDEPMLDPQDIIRCLEAKSANMSEIVNGFTWLGEDEDPANTDIPKVVANEDGRLLYISRSAIPGHKAGEAKPARYRKQVCIYGFTSEELAAFRAFGRKGALEAREDIEILRFFDLDRTVRMVETRPGSLTVDREEDVAPVEAAMRAARG